MSDPREGLPPCLSTVLFDGRVVNLVDGINCSHGYPARFSVNGGTVCPEDDQGVTIHGFKGWMTKGEIRALFTDDPAEAQAAFERGAEWVRTGEMA